LEGGIGNSKQDLDHPPAPAHFLPDEVRNRYRERSQGAVIRIGTVERRDAAASTKLNARRRRIVPSMTRHYDDRPWVDGLNHRVKPAVREHTDAAEEVGGRHRSPAIAQPFCHDLDLAAGRI